MRAAVGDRIVVKGHRSGRPERDGEVLEVRGHLGEPPYVIRWSDTGTEGLFFPGADAVVQHFGDSDEAVGPATPKVADVMTPNPVVVRPELPFADVLATLLDHDVSAVPVVDANGELVGIVSEADLMSREAYGGQRRRPLEFMYQYLADRDTQWIRKSVGGTASEVMTHAVVTASPDDDVVVAARKMLDSRVKRLVVVANGRVVGIVSRHDLLRTLAEELESQELE